MGDEKKSYRFRFTVPADDEAVVEWAKKQLNLSFSLRLLIKEHIAANGMGDPTCRPPQGTRRGRPPKNLQKRFDELSKDADEEIARGTWQDGGPDTGVSAGTLPSGQVYRVETEPVHYLQAETRGGAGPVTAAMPGGQAAVIQTAAEHAKALEQRPAVQAQQATKPADTGAEDAAARAKALLDF